MPRKHKVKELLEHGTSQPATVKPEDSLEQIVRSMIEDPRTEEVYVTDKEGVIKGVIDLRTLLRHLCLDCLPQRRSPHGILDILSSETAQDIMSKPVYVFPEDNLREVLEKMLKHDVIEIAVVNEEHKIIGNLRVKEFLWPWIHTDLE